MESTLYTIGFTKKTAEEFFHLLAHAAVRKVVDVRENRVGQLQGFTRFPDIAYFLERIVGAEYAYEPLFAPTPEIRKAYQASRDWNQYEKCFRELMAERHVLDHINPDDYQGKVALLCSESMPEKCHRRLLAEMLAAKWNATGHSVEVQHLVMPKPPREKKRRSRADDRASPV